MMSKSLFDGLMEDISPTTCIEFLIPYNKMKLCIVSFIAFFSCFYLVSGSGGDVYSIEGDHLGLAGGSSSGVSHFVSDSLTYQYPVSDIVSDIYSLSLGWSGGGFSNFTGDGLADDSQSDSGNGGSSGGSGGGFSSVFQEKIFDENAINDSIIDLPEQLFDIYWILEDSSVFNADELVGVVTFESFGTVPTFVNLTFLVLDDFGMEVYREHSSVVVFTEEVLRWNFEGLDLVEGDYVAVLQTLYNEDVYDEFRQNFNLGEKKSFEGIIFWVLGFALFVGLIGFLVWRIVKAKKLKRVKKKSGRKAR